ncbi:hypothetical protein BAE44_0014210 [Dichanthelium oligosanthes]|uniref:Tetratricopeptide repeat protein 33 n=1 Tax=Dichanthelium oligosanthes TaxID=888268 RepID=A0A1E5VI34_9POAL|nr:hypothetical protein BAE44_0014210 [Dichanthelium oligosanthes]
MGGGGCVAGPRASGAGRGRHLSLCSSRLLLPTAWVRASLIKVLLLCKGKDRCLSDWDIDIVAVSFIVLFCALTWGKNAKTKRQPVVLPTKPGLPFGAETDADEAEKEEAAGANTNCPGTKPPDTAESLQRQGDKLAEEGKYHEALSRWEAALTLAPDNAILYEQKAQEQQNWIRCGLRLVGLPPSCFPSIILFLTLAWVSLGRAQLNFGEPDSAILSFDKALAIKPDHDDTKADRETASRLVKKRGLLHSSGLSANKRRFTVGENSDKGAEGEEKADERAVQSG